MGKAEMMLDRVLHPPKGVLCTVPAASFAALIFIFASNREESAAAYPVFFLSAYALVILLAALPALGGRYLHDRSFRRGISIYQGMAVSFLYMIFRFAAAARYASVWFFSMAVYDMALCMMRAYLAFGYRRRAGKGASYELRCYRRTAVMLFLFHIPMGGMIVLMVRTNSGFSYPGYLIYLSALYTFYMMGLSIVNLVKFRKMESPILSAAKVLNFVSAMMSVLGLQTAMIARFSANGEAYRKMMNAMTGGAVFLIVMVTVVVMAVQSSKTEKEPELHEEIQKQIF